MTDVQELAKADDQATVAADHEQALDVLSGNPVSPFCSPFSCSQC
jgi:hypothetical protein